MKKVVSRTDMQYTQSMSLGLTNDVIFKYVFGAKESIPLLIDLVNAVLTDSGFAPIVTLTLKNPIRPRAENWLKGTELGILAENESGAQVDMEIRISGVPNFIRRSLYYWAQQYSQQLERGDPYMELKPVICINLVDFELVKNPEIFHSCYMLADKNLPGFALTNDLQIHFVELPKSWGFTGKLADWARFLSQTDKLAAEEVSIKADKVLREVYDRYRECLRDERAFFDALMRDKWQRNLMNRLKVARGEVIQRESREKVFETARNLKAMGLSAARIAQVTDLTPEEAENL